MLQVTIIRKTRLWIEIKTYFYVLIFNCHTNSFAQLITASELWRRSAGARGKWIRDRIHGQIL